MTRPQRGLFEITESPSINCLAGSGETAAEVYGVQPGWKPAFVPHFYGRDSRSNGGRTGVGCSC